MQAMKFQYREENVLHSKHGMHQELEPTHADPTRCPVLIQLDCIEVITQEPTDILKNTVSWLQEVNPGEKVQDQVALDIIRLLEHV